MYSSATFLFSSIRPTHNGLTPIQCLLQVVGATSMCITSILRRSQHHYNLSVSMQRNDAGTENRGSMLACFLLLILSTISVCGYVSVCVLLYRSNHRRIELVYSWSRCVPPIVSSHCIRRIRSSLEGSRSASTIRYMFPGGLTIRYWFGEVDTISFKSVNELNRYTWRPMVRWLMLFAFESSSYFSILFVCLYSDTHVSCTLDDGKYYLFDVRQPASSPAISVDLQQEDLFCHERYNDLNVLLGFGNGQFKHLDMRQPQAMSVSTPATQVMISLSLLLSVCYSHLLSLTPFHHTVSTRSKIRMSMQSVVSSTIRLRTLLLSQVTQSQYEMEHNGPYDSWWSHSLTHSLTHSRVGCFHFVVFLYTKSMPITRCRSGRTGALVTVC